MAFFGRGKNRIKNPYNISDMYESYSKIIEAGSVYDVGKQRYYDILKDFITAVNHTLLEESNWFRFGRQLGTFQIVKKKTYAAAQKANCSTSTDWAATIKYGKRVLHLNEHSGGYKYLFFWDKRTSCTSFITHYKFVPTRTIKRKLAFLIKTKQKDYFEYDTRSR